ncbi:MAG: hypothetical protein LBH01_02250 [Verrucomicrobiales bacterium]|jgi:T5SS/PEP-CTERM-associated repeat protein|nr:hypothetical protein [Verrucomicrobiales bacterium]
MFPSRLACLLVLALATCAAPLRAATHVWVKFGIGDWSDPNNWSPAGEVPQKIPDSSDWAVIGIGGTATLNTEAGVNSLHISRNDYKPGPGTLSITTGGKLTVQNAFLGFNAPDFGVATVDGTGQLLVTGTTIGLVIGQFGTGVLNIRDQAKVTAPMIYLGKNGSASNGTINLQGGTLQTGGIVRPDGTATLNLNGGTIVADAPQTAYYNTSSHANFFNGFDDLTLNGNGVASNTAALTFDTNGYIVTATNNFTFTRGGTDTRIALNKTGNGTLILTGTIAADFVDLTAGTLLINGDASALHVIDIQAGATLGGTGTIGGSQNHFANGTRLAPGAENAVGSLTLNGFVSLNGEALFDLASSTLHDRLLNNFKIGIGGTITINFLDGFDYQEGRLYSFDLMQGVTGDYLSNIQWQNLSSQWSILDDDSLTFIDGTLTFQLQQVREPSTWLLFGIGAIIFVICSLHRRRENLLK